MPECTRKFICRPPACRACFGEVSKLARQCSCQKLICLVLDTTFRRTQHACCATTMDSWNPFDDPTSVRLNHPPLLLRPSEGPGVLFDIDQVARASPASISEQQQTSHARLPSELATALERECSVWFQAEAQRKAEQVWRSRGRDGRHGARWDSIDGGSTSRSTIAAHAAAFESTAGRPHPRRPCVFAGHTLHGCRCFQLRHGRGSLTGATRWAGWAAPGQGTPPPPGPRTHNPSCCHMQAPSSCPYGPRPRQLHWASRCRA